MVSQPLPLCWQCSFLFFFSFFSFNGFVSPLHTGCYTMWWIPQTWQECLKNKKNYLCLCLRFVDSMKNICPASCFFYWYFCLRDVSDDCALCCRYVFSSNSWQIFQGSGSICSFSRYTCKGKISITGTKLTNKFRNTTATIVQYIFIEQMALMCYTGIKTTGKLSSLVI